MTSELPKISVAEALADRIVAVRAGGLPAATTRKCEDLLIDVVGLCVTARNEDYVKSALSGCDDDGPCTVVGHKRTLTAAGAAFVNGTAAHGEDFDDTFEGGPVHAGAVIVPAVLAACGAHNPDGRMALTGIAVGTEVLCRLSLVVPKGRPQGRLSSHSDFRRDGGRGRRRRSPWASTPGKIVDALGVAGSMAGGIIEYLAEGAWTKRLHAGWAAQSGIRAALLAQAGFVGPRTVFEGVHGLFHGFAHTTKGDYDALIWRFRHPLGDGHAGVQALSVRDYDASLHRLRAAALARRRAEDIAEIVCEVAEGSCTDCGSRSLTSSARATAMAPIRHALSAGDRLCPWRCRSGAFTETAIRDAEVLALAAKVKFVIDPDNPYPNNYTGHIRATLSDGSVLEERQPYLRGGAQEPLTRQDVTDKFALNAQHGGWTRTQSDATLKLLAGLYQGKIDLSSLRA